MSHRYPPDPLGATAMADAAFYDSEASNPVNKTSSVKRILNSLSDRNEVSSTPAAKSAKQEEASVPHNGASAKRQPRLSPSLPRNPTLTTQPTPAFAPRDEYVKRLFRDNPSVEIKLRWLSEINNNFSLDRNLAEVKKAAVTSRFVYIYRKRMDIINRNTYYT